MQNGILIRACAPLSVGTNSTDCRVCTIVAVEIQGTDQVDRVSDLFAVLWLFGILCVFRLCWIFFVFHVATAIYKQVTDDAHAL